MSNVEKKNTNKTVVELKKELGGTGVETLCINGIEVGIMGFSNEKDKQAALDAIQKAVDGSKTTIEAIGKLRTIAKFEEKDIEPDEEVTTEEGCTYIINYANKMLYNIEGEVVADCEDLKDIAMPKEAIKALLLERVK